MILDKFIKETKSWWENYLYKIVDLEKRGALDTKGGVVLFPNILIVTEVKGFLLAELVGAQHLFKGLKIKRHKDTSIYRYLNQFDDSDPDPLIKLDGSCQRFRFLCLAQEVDYNLIKNRFPFVELYQSRINRVGGKGSVFDFGNNFVSCCIENSVLINRHENIFRCKNILALFIVKKNISKKELIDLFNHSINEYEVKGVHTVWEDEDETLIIGGHLQSMYLFPGLHETTIGEFISSHPEIVKKAFKTTHFEYEPYFEWIEHDGSVQDKGINPDLMIKRDDGYYDIYDFKTAALTKNTILKGQRKRRRFIDYVEEGVAQLANYREYFEYPKNKVYAKIKYGIEVQNPKLVLIVGNWENTNLKEIEEACRRYREINIIDYDTFTHLFMGIKAS